MYGWKYFLFALGSAYFKSESYTNCLFPIVELFILHLLIYFDFKINDISCNNFIKNTRR